MFESGIVSEVGGGAGAFSAAPVSPIPAGRAGRAGRAERSLRWQRLADGEFTPELAASVVGEVVAVDPQGLTAEGRVAWLRCTERALSVLNGVQQRAVLAVCADVAASHGADPGAGQGSSDGRWVAEPECEVVSVALGVAPVTAGIRVARARSLVERLPELGVELSAGRIGLMHAVAIDEATGGLPVEVARRVVAEVVPLARRAAVGRVRRRASLLACWLDPASALERHQRALEGRGLSCRAEPDGMATLTLVTDAITARRILIVVDRVARGLTSGLTSGSAGVARADAAVALLLGGAIPMREVSQREVVSGPVIPAGRPVVAVHVALSTLVGLDSAPGVVPGLGPVPAPVARALAADSQWVRFLTDEVGMVVGVGRHRYVPGAALADLVRARDLRCQFPHCGQPASRCDLDHINPFDHARPARGGPTTAENLQALCRRHHRLKTAGVWSVVRARDGSLEWSGPVGLSHTVMSDAVL